MKTNEATWDRVVRVILGIVLFYLFFAGIITGALGWIVLVIGAVLLLTGVVGWCPLYALFKSGTKATNS